MAKLPKGYLEMGCEDYATLDVETLRAVYAELREIARYSMGRVSADSAIKAQNPVTPVEWIVAVKRVTCKCARCSGSGVFSWGACINGVMSHSAPCARCNGKGTMDFDDMRRGRAYDAYAIAKACGDRASRPLSALDRPRWQAGPLTGGPLTGGPALDRPRSSRWQAGPLTGPAGKSGAHGKSGPRGSAAPTPTIVSSGSVVCNDYPGWHEVSGFLAWEGRPRKCNREEQPS